jgi:hypothetical protein
VRQPPPAPPALGPAPSGTTITITAKNLEFFGSASVAAGTKVTVTLLNQDNLVAHDIGIKGGAKAELCTGPCQTSFAFTAPSSNFVLICSIHEALMSVPVNVR